VDVDLVINRRARRLAEGAAVRTALLRVAGEHGARVHETWTLEELDEVARGIRSRGTETVVLAGGDGSHMAGLSALARVFGDAIPRIALAPGGTVNTVARNLAIRGDAVRSARRAVVAAGRAGTTTSQPTLRITDDAGGERVGFIVGAGLVASFFDAHYAGGHPGLLGAAALATRVLGGAVAGTALARRILAPVACTLVVDGEASPCRAWSLVLASVLRDVGLHIRATYRGGEGGRFHVVASGASRQALALDAPRVLAGLPLRGEPHLDAQATSLAMTFEEQGAYVLDGDVFHARTVRVTPGPTVRLVVP
jgi:diacylglycerol kinase family enzyme